MSISREVPTSVHESSFVRNKLVTKAKTAISLVVTRGANVETGEKGRPKITFDEDDAGEKWLLDTWSYSVRLTLAVHRMSYVELIPIVREALRSVKAQGDELEAAWARGQVVPARCKANSEQKPYTQKRRTKNNVST
ncbi:hypothetical protein EIP91_009801 [Steccherinum ochraceum]|uniref:Uncharacterized protein n=1 Tax=Steccherinum ochraceum TaxID=92696 RepID=A0A4V2MX54_9APHY|nr:hypothetical protein EIP91_009801 [Steccherinum ochraceum]